VNTPEKMTVPEYVAGLAEYMHGKCPQCGRNISFVAAYLSIHAYEFPMCAGSGRVVKMDIPYCSVCEDETPGDRGCLHVPYAYQVGDEATIEYLLKILEVISSALLEEKA
jgi:hypothetical protein